MSKTRKALLVLLALAVLKRPVDMLLAHDFTEFFDTYMHRIFPKAGLPMGKHLRGGSVMMDPETDAYFNLF